VLPTHRGADAVCLCNVFGVVGNRSGHGRSFVQSVLAIREAIRPSRSLPEPAPWRAFGLAFEGAFFTAQYYDSKPHLAISFFVSGTSLTGGKMPCPVFSQLPGDRHPPRRPGTAGCPSAFLLKKCLRLRSENRSRRSSGRDFHRSKSRYPRAACSTCFST